MLGTTWAHTTSVMLHCCYLSQSPIVGNKSELLSWDYRAFAWDYRAFVFNRLCNLPFWYCALVTQALTETFALVIYTTWSFTGSAQIGWKCKSDSPYWLAGAPLAHCTCNQDSVPAPLATVQKRMNGSDLKGKTLTGVSLYAGRSTGCCQTTFLLL